MRTLALRSLLGIFLGIAMMTIMMVAAPPPAHADDYRFWPTTGWGSGNNWGQTQYVKAQGKTYTNWVYEGGYTPTYDLPGAGDDVYIHRWSFASLEYQAWEDVDYIYSGTAEAVCNELILLPTDTDHINGGQLSVLYPSSSFTANTVRCDGSILQLSGIIDVAGTISIGYATSGVGEYAGGYVGQRGGEVYANTIIVGDSVAPGEDSTAEGLYTIRNGTVTVDSLVVGGESPGVFNQYNDDGPTTVTVANDVEVGVNSAGYYYVDDSFGDPENHYAITLDCGTIKVGNDSSEYAIGTFSQIGGNVDAGSIEIAANSEYSIMRGLDDASLDAVSITGAGTFVLKQDGSMSDPWENHVTLDVPYISVGTFQLFEATLDVGTEYNVNTVHASNELRCEFSDFNQRDGADVAVGGNLIINDTGGGGGGGETYHIFGGDLYVAGDITYDLAAGHLDISATLDDYTFEVDGSINLTLLTIGETADGEFNWLDGEGKCVTVDLLRLGDLSDVTGTLNISGGELTVNTGIQTGSGTGIFNINALPGEYTLNAMGIVVTDLNIGKLDYGKLVVGDGMSASAVTINIQAGGGSGELVQEEGSSTGTMEFYINGDYLTHAKFVMNGGYGYTENMYLIGDGNMDYENGVVIQNGGIYDILVSLTDHGDDSGVYILNDGVLNVADIDLATGIGGTVVVNGGEINLTGTSASLPFLEIGYATGSAGNFTLPDGVTLTVTNPAPFATEECIGAYGDGRFTQTGGTNIAKNLVIGANAGASGTYNLQAGHLQVLNNIYNTAGTSTFIIDGIYGTDYTIDTPAEMAFDNFNVGNAAAGSFTLADEKTLTVTDEIVGNDAEGAFTQLGGTHTVANGFVVGKNSPGTYNFESGLLYVTGEESGEEHIGSSSDGEFNQSGGWHIVSTDLYIGKNAGASGTYSMTGGQLDVTGTEYIGQGGTGIFSQGSSTTHNAETISIGEGTYLYWWDATGFIPEMTVTSIVNAAGDGTLALDATQTGMYPEFDYTSIDVDHLVTADTYASDLLVANGQSIAAGDMVIGKNHTGVVSQSGGSVDIAGGLVMSENADTGIALYNLRGGTLTVGGDITSTGYASQINVDGGTLVLEGDSIEVTLFNVANDVGSTGSFTLESGKTLTAMNMSVGQYGTGTFTHKAGAIVDVSGTLYIDPGPPGGAGSGTYILEGGTITGTGDLIVRNQSSGTGTFRGYGTVDMSGTLTNNGKVIADGGTLDMTGFSAVVNTIPNSSDNGWYAQNGGKLMLPSIPVAEDAGDHWYIWGDSPANPVPDLVNSLKITFHNVTESGLLDIALWATNSSYAPVLESGTVVTLFSFDENTIQFETADILLRYNEAFMEGKDLDDFYIYHFIEGWWHNELRTFVEDYKQISTADLSGFSPVALIYSEGGPSRIWNGSSFSNAGNETNGDGGDDNPVPEPVTVLSFIAGMAMLGFRRVLKRRL